MNNPIFDSANATFPVVNIPGVPSTTTLHGLPLGTSLDSPLGEIGVKVIVVGGLGAGGGAVTIANGADAAEGATTNAPVADNTTPTSATAATGISLWKRIVNLLIAMLAKLPAFGTAGTASANVLSVQGVASGTTIPATLAAETTKVIGTINISAGAKVSQTQYTGAPSTSTVGTTDATVFTLAANEVGFIQNLQDKALAVKKGASASTSSFSFILKAGSAADDGTGGYTTIKDWVGAVSVASMSGTGRYIAWKQTL